MPLLLASDIVQAAVLRAVPLSSGAAAKHEKLNRAWLATAACDSVSASGGMGQCVEQGSMSKLKSTVSRVVEGPNQSSQGLLAGSVL